MFTLYPLFLQLFCVLGVKPTFPGVKRASKAREPEPEPEPTSADEESAAEAMPAAQATVSTKPYLGPDGKSRKPRDTGTPVAVVAAVAAAATIGIAAVLLKRKRGEKGRGRLGGESDEERQLSSVEDVGGATSGSTTSKEQPSPKQQEGQDEEESSDIAEATTAPAAVSNKPAAKPCRGAATTATKPIWKPSGVYVAPNPNAPTPHSKPAGKPVLGVAAATHAFSNEDAPGEGNAQEKQPAPKGSSSEAIPHSSKGSDCTSPAVQHEAELPSRGCPNGEGASSAGNGSKASAEVREEAKPNGNKANAEVDSWAADDGAGSGDQHEEQLPNGASANVEVDSLVATGGAASSEEDEEETPNGASANVEIDSLGANDGAGSPEMMEAEAPNGASATVEIDGSGGSGEVASPGQHDEPNDGDAIAAADDADSPGPETSHYEEDKPNSASTGADLVPSAANGGVVSVEQEGGAHVDGAPNTQRDLSTDNDNGVFSEQREVPSDLAEGGGVGVPAVDDGHDDGEEANEGPSNTNMDSTKEDKAHVGTDASLNVELDPSMPSNGAASPEQNEEQAPHNAPPDPNLDPSAVHDGEAPAGEYEEQHAPKSASPYAELDATAPARDAVGSDQQQQLEDVSQRPDLDSTNQDATSPEQHEEEAPHNAPPDPKLDPSAVHDGVAPAEQHEEHKTPKSASPSPDLNATPPANDVVGLKQQEQGVSPKPDLDSSADNDGATSPERREGQETPKCASHNAELGALAQTSEAVGSDQNKQKEDVSQKPVLDSTNEVAKSPEQQNEESSSSASHSAELGSAAVQDGVSPAEQHQEQGTPKPASPSAELYTTAPASDAVEPDQQQGQEDVPPKSSLHSPAANEVAVSPEQHGEKSSSSASRKAELGSPAADNDGVESGDQQDGKPSNCVSPSCGVASGEEHETGAPKADSSSTAPKSSGAHDDTVSVNQNEQGPDGAAEDSGAAIADDVPVDSWTAAKDGNLDLLKDMLSNGTDMDAVDEKGCSCLWLAASHGHLSVVKELIARGADVNKADKDCTSPLLAAASQARVAVVQVLLEAAGVDVNARDALGHSPLWTACSLGLTEVVRVLVKRGEVELNARDSGGRSALHAAAAAARVGAVRALLGCGGVDVEAKDAEGSTPLAVVTWLMGVSGKKEGYPMVSKKKMENWRLCKQALTARTGSGKVGTAGGKEVKGKPQEVGGSGSPPSKPASASVSKKKAKSPKPNEPCTCGKHTPPRKFKKCCGSPALTAGGQ
jgi:ankyrin repeat protein